MVEPLPEIEARFLVSCEEARAFFAQASAKPGLAVLWLHSLDSGRSISAVRPWA